MKEYILFAAACALVAAIAFYGRSEFKGGQADCAAKVQEKVVYIKEQQERARQKLPPTQEERFECVYQGLCRL